MGAIQETNEAYYQGSLIIPSDGTTTIYQFDFETELVIVDPDPTGANYGLNNVKIEYSPTGLAGTWVEQTTVKTNPLSQYGDPGANYISWNVAPAAGFLRATLSQAARWNNYGGYEYISLEDVINNFLIGYVGEDKIIPSAKRTDVIFYAKRGLQEFSYDTLKSIKSQELSIPSSLSVVIPQDYVNYVQLSWIDEAGVKRIIYPTDLTINPTEVPIQDATPEGLPTQNSFGANNQSTSITEERWRTYNPNFDPNITGDDFWRYWNMGLLGQRYGLEPEISQSNGWFTVNHLEGKFSFSSNLTGKLIVIEYISDGLAYDLDSKVPKFAEEALYMHIAYSLLAVRPGIPEYIVTRFKKDRRAALRNAKIRLSNIKLNEFVQIMRGKSKWIKY